MTFVLRIHYSTFSLSNFHTKHQKITELGQTENTKLKTATDNVLPEGPYFVGIVKRTGNVPYKKKTPLSKYQEA